MILQLTPDIIAGIDGFQLKSATNVFNSIHKVIDVPQPIERYMMASNVFGLGLGEKKFKLIIDAIPNFLEKWKKGKITKSNIISIDGFSDKSTDIFISGMPKFLEWLDLYNMIKLENREEKAVNDLKNNKFANMVIVFTGIRNADMEKEIVDGGGSIGSSISGKTSIVVAKDVNESSSKLNTAREKGIPIMSINEFGKKYGLI